MPGTNVCWCDSGKPADQCCAAIMSGRTPAPTAEALMRSRYSAFATANAAWLRDSWHPDTRPVDTSVDASVRWIGLKIAATSDGGADDETGTVEFIARCKRGGRAHRMHEISRFSRVNGRWVYVDGDVD